MKKGKRVRACPVCRRASRTIVPTAVFYTRIIGSLEDVVGSQNRDIKSRQRDIVDPIALFRRSMLVTLLCRCSYIVPMLGLGTYAFRYLQPRCSSLDYKATSYLM